jgi:predicted small secreted protein
MPAVTIKQTAKSVSKAKIDVKRAVGIAADYFSELFPQVAKANVMLEEIEESSDGRYWLVTLGYDVQGGTIQMFKNGPFRSYKTFRIDANTGKVISVKIRPVP